MKIKRFYKKPSYCLIFVLIFFLVNISFAQAAEPGDVNEDNSIDIVDALLIAQYYVGLDPLNFNQANAEIDCSGEVDIIDALLVAQYYVNLISSFPCSTTQPPIPTPTATTRPTSGPMSFITRSGSKLYEDGNEFRFVSVNIPNYFIVEDCAGNVTSAWHRVTEFEQRDACRAVKRLGGQVFRTYVFSVQGGRNVQNNLAHITGSGGTISYNEDLFKDVDRGLVIAREEGVRMYIPLVDNWEWFGGYAEWAAIAGGGDFWTSSTIKGKFKDFITWLVNRTNTVNGIQYKNDPVIMGWELGNEIDKANDTWITEMAAHIKSQDSNHLVIDGSHKSIPQASLSSSNIDVVTTHYTDGDITSNTQRAAQSNKAYIYGEFRTDGSVSNIVNTTISSGAAGCLIWSLRFRTEYGGFYFHSDFDGSSDSLQYPGFPETLPSNERDIFTTLRNGAYQIRGQSSPTESIPPAPFLLSISRTSEINWQGSAGAFNYIVQRSTSPTGSWTTLSSNVSDARKNGDTAALPLYSDNNPGSGTFYYRVIALNNAGESEPSNVVNVTN